MGIVWVGCTYYRAFIYRPETYLLTGNNVPGTITNIYNDGKVLRDVGNGHWVYVAYGLYGRNILVTLERWYRGLRDGKIQENM